MTDSLPFRITRDGAVAHLRLSRPEASNALDMRFWRGLGPALKDLDAGGDVRALVLSGEGRNFCAGMDISVFSDGAILGTDTAAERQAFHQAARDLQDALSVLERVRFPVIAAVQGACVGAGLDMIAACDLRLAAEGAYFRIEEINIGMMADVGSLQRLPRLLPEGVVRELAYLGTSLTSDRAERLGFVNAVLPDADSVLAAALEMAHGIAAKAPLAISGSKAAITYARDHTVADGLEWAAVMQGSIWNTADILGAIQARATKGTPAFADLSPLPRP
ncbi:MAG: enoyl-CoA hydratase-related protein [Brevundimonas sp.]|uniref:enoyl-CoA hydratase-related protein n=1 Tax=Brevundimonas sp. TaxID=1871086 RepID=UPI00300182DB